MSIAGSAALVLSGGHPGKRRIYRHMAGLGVRLVFVDEPGHWSEGLGDEASPTRSSRWR